MDSTAQQNNVSISFKFRCCHKQSGRPHRRSFDWTAKMYPEFARNRQIVSLANPWLEILVLILSGINHQNEMKIPQLWYTVMLCMYNIDHRYKFKQTYSICLLHARNSCAVTNSCGGQYLRFYTEFQLFRKFQIATTTFWSTNHKS